jgi:uncharacterized protein
MRPRPRFALLALAAGVLLAGTAPALGPAVPPAPTRFVTDNAGALSADTAARLERTLRDFEDTTSNQFLVYTESSVPENTTLEEYTVACAQAWKAGQKERKNGMILFVFPKSRKVRLEVGYGLEGAMPDALANRIVEEEVLPRFKSDDFDGGITAGVSAAIAATKGEYQGTGSRRERTRKNGGIPWWLIFIIFFFVLPSIFGRRRRGFWYLGGGGFGRGGFGGGWGGGGGGGGFSGGGGSFGGGGASGSW